MTASNITGIKVDASITPADALLAEGWLLSWQSLGGAVTIGPAGQIVPWMHFADRKAVKVSCRLVNQLLDTPGLPLALRTLIEKVPS